MRPLILLLLCALTSPAAGQGVPGEEASPWVVAIYTPRVFFPNSLARGRYATEVAAALQAATGQPFRGRAFGASDEFNRQIAAGTVHFAVVDAQLVIERGYAPIAQATAGGRPALPMVLVSAGGAGTNVGALAGRSVAHIKVGKGDGAFLSEFLLQGQVPRGYFKAGRSTRDVQGALSLVRLGKADLSLTYAGATGGLSPVFRSRPVPLPVFVRVGPVPADLLKSVRAAARGLRIDAGLFDRFGAYQAKTLAPLRRALAGGAHAAPKPLPTQVLPDLPPVSSFIGPLGPPPVQMPAAGRSLGVIPPPEDLL